MGCTHSVPTPRNCSPTLNSSSTPTPDSTSTIRSSSTVQTSSTIRTDLYSRPATPHPHSPSSFTTNSRWPVSFSIIQAGSSPNSQATVRASIGTNSSTETENYIVLGSQSASIQEADAESGSSYTPIGPRLSAPCPLLAREQSIQWYDGYVSGESGGNGGQSRSDDREHGKKVSDGGQ
jgi:hypothetical protein